VQSRQSLLPRKSDVEKE